MLKGEKVPLGLERFFVHVFFFKYSYYNIFNRHLLKEHKVPIERAYVVSHKLIVQQSCKANKKTGKIGKKKTEKNDT